jgi:Domain of unknown function (DUF4129)
MSSRYRSLADFRDIGWRTGVFRALLIAVLATGATSAPVALLRILTPWRMAYLLPLAFLAALIGIFDTVRLGRPDWRHRRGLVFRMGEVVLLLVLAQITIWSVATGWPSAPEFVVWLRHPDAFPAGQLVATGLLMLGSWWLAVLVTGDFLELAIQPDEVAARESHGWGVTRSQWRVFRPVGRDEIVGRFARRWVWGGVVLVTLAALSGLSVTQDARDILRFSFSPMGLLPDVVVGLLCYFLAGLLLLSDARLAVLRGRWYNEDVKISPGVMRYWHITGLLMILIVAGAALLLPLGSTDWLGQALEWVIALAMRIVMALLLLLSLLMSLLLYPFRFLLKPGGDEPIGVLPRPTLDLPTQTEAANRLPDWLGGAVFWIAVAVVGGYLLAVYLRAHGRLPGLGDPRLLRLRLWWRGRRSRIEHTVQQRVAALRVRRGRSRSGGSSSAIRPMRMGDLLPRAQVRRLYLEALRWAGERGLQRPPHRTPLEFADDLDANWPDAEPDVQVLTQAFMEARYTARDIAPIEARRAQNAWQRLMATLRHPAGHNTAPRP